MSCQKSSQFGAIPLVSSNPDQFFDELRTWSETKLRILTKYVDAYLNKRGRFHARIVVVDGFAGREFYGDPADPSAEGSPIRIARLAVERKSQGKRGEIYQICCEENRSNYDELVEALIRYPQDSYRVYLGDFKNHLQEIFKLCGNSPAFFFLDPYGPTGVALNAIEPVLRRRDTEVLLNFNTRRLIMLAGNVDSTAKDAAQKVRLVSRILEGDADNTEWIARGRQFNPNGRNGARWALQELERYKAKIRFLNPDLQYVVSYPVRESIGSEIKYHLVFATRSVDGLVFMNDFICTEDEELFQKVRDPLQRNFLDTVLDRARMGQVDDLKQDILEFGLEHQGVNRAEIIRAFCVRRFGEFKQKHYRQALDLLETDGLVAFGPGGKDKTPLTFYRQSGGH